jgi:pullulanase/glycogen debranching enzyme
MRTALPPVTAALAILACSPSAKNSTTDTAVATPAPAGLARATATKPSADPSFHPAWSKHAVIYEVNVRQYTPEGTLSALRSHIPRLKALGVDILWLMPVQPIGQKNRKGKLGSYYAISDYTAVNPEFGTLADFKAVVDAAHSEGLKVIPRLGGEPYRLRSRVGHRASRFLRAEARWLAHERARQRRPRNRLD